MKTRLFLLLAFLLASLALSAQTFRGGIQGTVLDKSGAAIPAAQVTVTNTGTGFTRTVQTDDSGNFTFTELPLGTYSVTATKAGFQTETQKDFPVVVSSMQRLDMSLTAGDVKEAIEVTAEAPLVETAENTLGGTIEAKQFAQLPVNGRDFTKMLSVVPGGSADASAAGDSPGSYGLFSINGNRGRSNNYLLDGTDMNDGFRNLPAINEGGVFGTPATLLPTDAVQEMGILSNEEPEYGRNSGGVVNIVTKSGTNNIHGTVFEDFRNNGLDARNYFNAKPQPQDVFHNNQFGVSAGGPIIKDRTFWFASWEGWRETGGLPNIESVPSVARINAYTTAGGTINPVIQNLLGRNPWGVALPATGDTGADNKTLQVTDHFTNRVDSVILKFDHHFGNSDPNALHDLLTGRYFFGDSDQSFPLALGGGTTVPDFNTVTPTRVQVVSLSYTHFFTPRLFMEVRGGWNRFAEGFFPQDQKFDPSSIGLNMGTTAQDFGLPIFSFSDGTSGLGSNLTDPRHRFDTNWQYFTNLSYTAGKHNWKFGGEWRRTTINQYYDLGYRGKLKFSSFEDFLSGTASNGGSQFAGNSHRNTHQNNLGFYAQDNFRLTRNVTLNYGIRWDYYGVISESNNQLSTFDPATATVKLVGPGGLHSLYPRDLNNFSPRLSIAWDLFGNGKTVVRSGWGIYYDAFSQDMFLGHFPFNTFNPGVATNGVGINPITAGSFTGTQTDPVTGDSGGAIVTGVPVFSAFTPTTDVWTVDQKIRTPYIQNYNLNIQQQISRYSALQIAYVGSTGKKLFRFRDINQADPATGAVPYPGFTYINQIESTAFSNYNSLQASWNIRDMHGFTSTMNYTYSHSIDNASDTDDYVPNASQPDNSFNVRGEKASSNFDHRHNFIWQSNYDLPKFGESASWLTSGWSVDGLLRITSGQPYNLNSFNNYNGSGEYFERPDVVGNPFSGVSTPNAILNLSAFAAPCDWDPTAGGCIAGTQHFGNLRRNAFYAPGFKNFDFSLVKNNKLTEKVTMQLRADFFNIFNHPNFSNPLLPNFLVNLENNASVAPTAAELATGGACNATSNPSFAGCRAVGQGFLPITATPDVGIGNPFLGGGGNRNIQFGLRFSF